jgi:hypothetical protein
MLIVDDFWGESENIIRPNKKCAAMIAIKAVFDNGQVVFPPGTLPEGRREVIVTFLDEETMEKRDPEAGKRFVEKWCGVIKGADIDNWKDQKAEEILKKHS